MSETMQRFFHPGPSDETGNPTGTFVWYDPASDNSLLRQGIEEEAPAELKKKTFWRLHDILNEFETNGGYMNDMYPIIVWRSALLMGHLYITKTERLRWYCSSSWSKGTFWMLSGVKPKLSVFAAVYPDTQTLRVTNNKRAIEFNWSTYVPPKG